MFPNSHKNKSISCLCIMPHTYITIHGRYNCLTHLCFILQHFVGPTRLVRTSAILAAATATFAQISTSLNLENFRTYISEEWAPHIAGFLDSDNHSDFWAPFMASAALPYLRNPVYATFYKRRGRDCWAVNITKYGNMVAAMVYMLVPQPAHCLHTLVYPIHGHTMMNLVRKTWLRSHLHTMHMLQAI